MSVATFTGVKDPGARADLMRFATSIEGRLLAEQGQFATVVFGSAGVDVDIPHSLRVTDPESIRWVVVSTTAAAIPYKDTSASRKAWTASHIWLRSSAAATIRLFLFTEPTA